MALWTDFAAAAPRIAEVFTRRHAATGNLCMLGTLRPDGFPRISPMEPRFLEGDLWLVGMPDTAKFADLAADPRFALHTATVDTQVGDGDAKLWGRVEDVRDEALHQRFAVAVYEDIGVDLRVDVRPVLPAGTSSGRRRWPSGTTTWTSPHGARAARRR